jgi:hypothetical protein
MRGGPIPRAASARSRRTSPPAPAPFGDRYGRPPHAPSCADSLGRTAELSWPPVLRRSASATNTRHSGRSDAAQSTHGGDRGAPPINHERTNRTTIDREKLLPPSGQTSRPRTVNPGRATPPLRHHVPRSRCAVETLRPDGPHDPEEPRWARLLGPERLEIARPIETIDPSQIGQGDPTPTGTTVGP